VVDRDRIISAVASISPGVDVSFENEYLTGKIVEVLKSDG
jgi:hypothetical protein